MIRVPDSGRKNLINDLLPDLTPLLDIVFMLIVFLILTINTSLYSLEVNVPTDKDAVSQAVTDDKSISVHLLGKGKGWKINKSTYLSEEEFRKDLAKIATAEYSVMIISDKNAPVEKLVSLLTFLEKNKISKANIMVEKL